MIKRYIFRAIMSLILVIILTSGMYDFLQSFMIVFAMISVDVTIERHLLGGGDDKE